MLKFYGDESIDPATSLMNISGFLMEEDQFVRLDQAIKDARGELPYFHMKEGHHYKHPDVYQKLLGLVSEDYVMCGISASMFLSEHRAMTALRRDGQPLYYWMGKPYTYLLGVVMSVCAEYQKKFSGREDFIAYFFENGHANQGDAESFWSQLSKQRFVDLKNYYRYDSHTFLDGKGPLGSVCQVADIFAWHMNKNTPITEVGKTFSVPIMSFHHGPAEIYESLSKQFLVWNAETARKAAITERLHGSKN